MHSVPKPFSQACENNKTYILDVLTGVFKARERVLEIGSGTGQHAVYFSGEMPQVLWQPSDTPDNLPVLLAGLAGEDRDNLLPPLSLNVRQRDWPVPALEGVFSANCLHIIPEEAVADFFAGIGSVLKTGGHVCVYGPFRYNGEFTTPSNARFDLWLKDRDPRSGVRDFETVNSLAEEAGLTLLADHPMPANNQCLVWRRTR